MNKKYNVLHIISSLKIGGAEVLLCDLIEQLNELEIESSVLYFHDGPIRGRLESLNVPVFHVKGLVSLYDPLFLYNLARLIKQINPHCIHTSLWAANFFGRIMGRILGYRVVSAVHLDVAYEGTIRNALDRYTFSFAHKIVAISDTVSDSIGKQGWLDKQKITTIKNGITVKSKQHSNLNQRALLGLSDANFIIGSVGRFIPRKNYGWLIHAFKELLRRVPHARLVLIGLGPEERALRGLAKNLQIEKYIVFIIGESPFSYYPLFDCFVLPSLQEGLSIALLEAMSFGLPPIVSHQDRHHDVIADGHNGFIININDVDGFIFSIDRLLNDPETAKIIRLNAEKTVVERFNSTTMAQAYKTLYQNLIF